MLIHLLLEKNQGNMAKTGDIVSMILKKDIYLELTKKIFHTGPQVDGPPILKKILVLPPDDFPLKFCIPPQVFFLLKDEKKDYKPMCLGSIINENVILTSRVCCKRK